VKTGSGDLWGNVLKSMRKVVSRQVFETWFKQTTQISITNNSLVVEVPGHLYKQLLQEKYSTKIQEIVEEIAQQRMEIIYQVAPEKADEALPLFASEFSTSQDLDASPPEHAAVSELNRYVTSSLQPHYTFERFIVGPSNQFAHAAAQAVADKPSGSYNPLFLHGGVGLGKTHLMHAIGNTILGKKPEARVLYVQSEQFTNEMISHIRYEKMAEFRSKYRSVDVLMIDDIQFIAGKDSTVSEFFHTFNTLYGAHKQIIITSDQPPRSISNLEERIRSRFEAGLIADIQPPTLETKVAILQKKADEMGLILPNDIALFIASKVKSNIRELEGSLVNLTARSSLTGAKIDMDAAWESLRQYVSDNDHTLTIETVQKQVAQYFDIKTSALRAKGRTQDVSIPRQIAMYLCREFTNQSLSEIGKKFGGRNHTTVIHACRKVEMDMVADAEIRTQVNLLKGMLQD